MNLPLLFESIGLRWPANRFRQRRFIEEYSFSLSLLARFSREHPELSNDHREQVWRSLRRYFLLCHDAKGRMVAMPSKIVDDAWHMFILFTHDYDDFCRQAFGHYLHHTPDEAMPEGSSENIGMIRAWNLACKRDGINPLLPATLPFLFALDGALKVPGGMTYEQGDMAAMADEWEKTRRAYGAASAASGCGGSGGCSGGHGGHGCGGGHGGGCCGHGCGGGCGSSGCGGSGCGGGGCGGGGCGGGGCGGG